MLSASRFIYQSRKLFNCGVMPRNGFPAPTLVVARIPSSDIRSHCMSGPHLSRLQNDFTDGKELFNIIKTACSEVEGPDHCWLNNVCNANKFFDNEGIFLVLVNAYIQDKASVDHHDHILLIERVKFLQKRYPKLNVIGLQCASSAKSVMLYFEALKTIMQEYITFPVLIVNRNLFTVTDSAVYLYFEGSGSHLCYIKPEAELESIQKAIDELSSFRKEDMSKELNGRPSQHAIMEEPNALAYFRNFLLSNAGSLSVDEDGDRIFLSDSNNHRIIIADGNGKIQDSIGSSPGFVDSDFEESKLCRPAASFYNVSDGCLYFVDSENNAIRRADMESRLVETMYPVPRSIGTWARILGLWSWILNSFGLAKEKDEKTSELHFDPISSPWHLLNFGDDEVIIISHSFAVAWIMSMTTWKIKEVIRGFQNIFESYGNLIMDKLSFVKDAYGVIRQKNFSVPVPLEGFCCAALMSSVGNFGDDTIIYDADGQSLLKYNRISRCTSRVHFSNVGILGVPYWLNCPVERVFSSTHYISQSIDHVHDFHVLPGRCDITVNVKIPEETLLAAPLEENCIWCQARGSAAVVSGFGEEHSPKEKVGIAQQWFDELDNLAFTNPELGTPDYSEEIDGKTVDRSFQDSDKVHFNCAVNVSPGTSEVIVSAALYLKPKPSLNIEDVASLLNPLKHDRGKMASKCMALFLEKHEKISEFIFMKPLHLRIKLDCGDHPTPTDGNTKETILTETRFMVDVILE